MDKRVGAQRFIHTLVYLRRPLERGVADRTYGPDRGLDTDPEQTQP